MQAFYDSVLPSGTVLIASRLGETRDHSPHHFIAATKVGLEARMEHYVQQGLSVHMALGGFADQLTSPDANGVQYVPKTTELTPVLGKAVALDLDVGDLTNKYNSLEAAQSSVKAAIAAQQLPTPTWMVLSGGGMHLYWAFTHEVNAEQWFNLQHRFHQNARRFLTLDPGGTTKPHVCQRSPQSWNYKFEPARKCMVSQTGPELDPADLDTWLPDMEVPEMSGTGAGPEYGVVALNSVFFTTGCGQLKRVLDHGAHSRDDWIALANVAYYMTDGNEQFHQASAKYEGYDREESQHTLEEIQVNASAGPWPCAKFVSGHESICASCPARSHGATNPVSAARMVKRQYDLQQQQAATTTSAESAVPAAQPAATPETDATVAADPVLAALSTPTIEVELQSPSLQRFFADSGSLFYMPAGNDEGETPKRVLVCRPYITIEALSVNEKSSAPGLMVRSHHPRHVDLFRIDNLALVNERAMSEKLVEFGVVVEKPGLMVRYIKARHQELQDSAEPPVWEYVRFGWKDPTLFLTYNGLLDTTTGEDIECFRDAYTQSLCKQFGGQEGDVDGWIKAMQIYQNPMLTSLLAPTLLSLGTALLVKLKERDIGVYSLWGATNSGKSTSAEFAQSCWGTPVRTHVTAGTSAVTVLNALTYYHHLPMIVDEVTIMTPAAMQQLVFSITQGREKDRMTTQAKPIPPGTWQNSVMFTTNESVVEMLSTARQSAQAEVSRVLEVKQDHFDEALIEPTNAAVQQLSAHHGIFGPRFLCHFMANQERFLKLYSELKKHISNRVTMDSSANRQSMRFRITTAAVCCLAHAIAKEIDKQFPRETQAVVEWFLEAIARSTKAGLRAISSGDLIPDDLLSVCADRIKTVAELDAMGYDPKARLKDFIIEHRGDYYFQRPVLGDLGMRSVAEVRALLNRWRDRDYLNCPPARLETQLNVSLRVNGKNINRPRMVCIRKEAVTVRVSDFHLEAVEKLESANAQAE